MHESNIKTAMEETVFEVVLYPHRSLGRKGFRLLLGMVLGASTFISIPLYIMGAWPVIGFFGLDVGLLYILFKRNYRSMRQREHIVMTHALLSFSRYDNDGALRQWRFNPRWVQLRRDDHSEFGTLRLCLAQRGHEVEIARCLGSQARSVFANTLAGALAGVRKN